MCTVTYVPTQKDQFLFASNRDEAPKRAAAGIVREQRNDKTILYPQDTGAKGTWIAVSDANQLVCILNGAFVIHHRQLPYRLSRGIMALEFFDYDNAEAFRDGFEFEGMEPFTMVIYDQGRLFDIRWDHLDLHCQELDANSPHIWASCTLYSRPLQEKRQEWFGDWLGENEYPERKDLALFHREGGDGDSENDVVMNRQNIVRTTSITSINKGAEELSLNLHRLSTDEEEEHLLRLQDGKNLHQDQRLA